MTRPDPKSFTTLEAAQAEIARCYATMDRDDRLFDLATAKLDEMRQQVERIQAELGQ